MMNAEAESLRAGIFDMDGVLLDSEPLHHEAVNELLADAGCAPLSFADYAPYMGTTDEFTWNDLIRRYKLPHRFDYYRERYDEVILRHYQESSVLALGAETLLDALQRENLTLAIASSSRAIWVQTCLEALGIGRYFATIVSGDMVRHSKPDPEIYLLAAERIGIQPRHCFAVEDSPNGVAAAVAAGMFTVAVSTPYTEDQDTGAAHLRVQALSELDSARLREGHRLLKNGMRTV
jgi:HAD superfamily hydrolase (TIGR01509 family)